MHPSMILRGAIARAGIRPYPLSLSYEVTWRCNLECTYCDRHTPLPRELTRDGIFRALGEFYDLGMRDAHLDGGDPLTHRHIDEIVDWLVDRHITVSMNTNGILVPRKIATMRKLSGVTISLDGPRDSHDSQRGAGSFDRAVAGAKAVQGAEVPVEFTCTVGRHNVDAIEELVEIADALGIPVVFQPALNSLFLDSERDGSAWQLDAQSMRAAFARIEQIKRRSTAVGNAWSSLKHFRQFPEETPPPCAAGWVTATMDPEGVLFPCGQLSRADRSNSVVRLGAATAFANLSRRGCGQCWCARLVQENYAWGMRVDRMLPPLGALVGNLGRRPPPKG
jgi:MoaA/NifB/PqqE/SkfB family radical SAM enzyme